MVASFEISVIAGIRAILLAIPESAELLVFGILLTVTAVLIRRLLRRLEDTKQNERTADKT